ncbi:DNA polymerase [Azorhizobium caulinodans ORS 571]|uniref:DNA polymerase I n=1 Tax=Azorhizobium caulinodans (strain ATCC 43989 / DSM 5975 / JCM 20966 / LMG 6465 / NBRC 14845 / NCIMB 13405 / ORS 571) TaxID=438753 RepID=A8IFA9_AZOC5|nr:DNA polymerase [Azorhizobium caulinodans]BAF89595.1 DNA polymerase [Azorhizobium caulinodans ORS 571]
MSHLIFDIETNGLLDATNRVHCLCIKDADTGQVWSCTDDGPTGTYIPIERGLQLLADAEVLIGHNILKFDIPALQKVYPWWKPKGVLRDTIVCSRLIWPKDDLRERDFRLQKQGKLPGNLIGRYALEAWGYRLGEYKGDYKGPWDVWSQEMQDYCEQDVEVTFRLYQKIKEKGWKEESIELEHRVQWIIHRQEQYGFLFDQAKAASLYADLVQRKTELEAELQSAFPPWEVESVFVPKVNNRVRGYVKGVPFTKRRTIHFKPSSRDHIAGRLKAKYGWEPSEFTDEGKPKVDEDVLSHLPYPEAKLLSEYLMVEKRLGQIATGKEAWLKHVKADGRIHGDVTTNGAVTGRMTHSKPNIAQVPGNGSPYGHRCRELFVAAKRKLLVGCDADALELRCLAGYMARYDGGAYVRTVLEGKKELGTDMHTLNAKALGCSRDVAKVWFYAFIYGAGDFKLGTILGAPKGEEQKWGRRSRARFLKALPALGTIIKKVQEKVQKKGFLRGLDGRELRVRSAHSAFNTLLQSAGAVLMKMALVLLDEDLQAAGYVPGQHYEFVANVHDEWQIEVNEEIAEDVGKRAVTAIVRAGEHFGFGCPLSGNFAVGRSWAETH